MKFGHNFGTIYEGPMQTNHEYINQFCETVRTSNAKFVNLSQPSSFRYPVYFRNPRTMNMVFNIVRDQQALPTHYHVLTDQVVWIRVFL